MLTKFRIHVKRKVVGPREDRIAHIEDVPAKDLARRLSELEKIFPSADYNYGTSQLDPLGVKE